MANDAMTDQARTPTTRYDLVTNYRAGSSIEEMERSDDGEWVRYEDVAAALLAAEQREQALRNQLVEAQAQLQWIGECVENLDVSHFAESFPLVRAVADIKASEAALREALKAARDALVSLTAQCGVVPNQGISTTMTEAEQQAWRAVKSLDTIIADAAIAAPSAPPATGEQP